MLPEAPEAPLPEVPPPDVLLPGAVPPAAAPPEVLLSVVVLPEVPPVAAEPEMPVPALPEVAAPLGGVAACSCRHFSRSVPVMPRHLLAEALSALPEDEVLAPAEPVAAGADEPLVEGADEEPPLAALSDDIEPLGEEPVALGSWVLALPRDSALGDCEAPALGVCEALEPELDEP